MTPTERIATELLGYKPCKRNEYWTEIPEGKKMPVEVMLITPDRLPDCFDCGLESEYFEPFTNPAHATMVWEKAIECGNSTLEIELWKNGPEGNLMATAIYCRNETNPVYGTGDTWMEALCNAVIAFLDAKKEANDEEK